MPDRKKSRYEQRARGVASESYNRSSSDSPYAFEREFVKPTRDRNQRAFEGREAGMKAMLEKIQASNSPLPVAPAEQDNREFEALQGERQMRYLKRKAGMPVYEGDYYWEKAIGFRHPTESEQGKFWASKEFSYYDEEPPVGR